MTSRILLLLAVLAALGAAEGGRGGAGGAGGGGGGGAGGAGGNGGQIPLPDISQAEVDATIAALTDEQRDLLREIAEAEMPGRVDLALRLFAAHLRGLDASARDSVFAQLRDQAKRVRRQRDPLAVDPEERAAADRLPAAAAADIMVVADPAAAPEAVAASWIRVQAYGSPVRPLLLDRARALPADSIPRLRLLSLAGLLIDPEPLAATLRALDAAEVARRAAGDGAVAMLARTTLEWMDKHPAENPLAGWCYYSFPKRAHGYEHAVSLDYGNGGREFQVRMYGGQDSELLDLGAIAKAPLDWPAALAAAGVAAGEIGQPVVAGHLYVEHHLEQRDGIDLVVAFRVAAVEDDWVVIVPLAPVQ
jgi:hypothetical protein